MSWLDEIIKERLKTLPEDAFTDRTFGFGDIKRVVDLVERAVDRNTTETGEAGRERALKAAANPFHDFVKNPVFAPMGAELWKVSATFPRILRSALLVAIYSHTEFLLLSWCEDLARNLSLPDSFTSKRKSESFLARYVRYMRDDAGLELADIESWPEWHLVNSYRSARNCLAHNGGIVKAKDRTTLAGLPHVEIDETGLQLSEPLFHLLPGACEAAAEACRAFVGRLVGVAEADPRGSHAVERGG